MSEETIIREVDEELRGDRMRALWRRFGPWVIGAAVLVVVAVGANEGWRWWQDSSAARTSDQFYAALEAAEAGRIEEAQAALAAVEANGSGGYPLVARFRDAALLARQGRTADAVAAYDALATASDNQYLRELALMLGANLLVDAGDVAAVQQRVGGLVTPGDPLRNAAREAIGLSQYRAGDLDAALATLLDVAADPLANPQAQQRVQIYIEQLVALGAMTAQQRAAAEAAPAVVETPAAAPAEPATAAPVETPAMAPAEAPAIAPVETPAMAPAEAPAVAPAESGVGAPAEPPDVAAPADAPVEGVETPAAPAPSN